MQQLPLSLHLNDDATLNNFYQGNNAELIELLQQLLTRRNNGEKQLEQVVYLWGKAGSGRSHLLQAACHEAGELGLSATYLPLSEHAQFSVEILEGLDQLQLICIDDIEAIAGNALWEEQLFHLYNRIKESGCLLFVAGSDPLHANKINLKDLNSRLGWGLVFHLHSLSDEEKIIVLQKRAHERGFELSDSVAQYLLRHCSRTMNELFLLLEKLDHASLVAKRKLTVPFIKEVLDI